jgi:DNA-binding response OmpR family regulator
MPPPGSATQAAHAPPRRAVVAATDPAIQRLCKDVLTGLGYSIANGLDSGAGAVIAARHETPDIILLSQQLSDVPAREAVKWLRSNAALAATPIIIIGGRGDGDAGEVHAAMVLPRPVSAARLARAIAETTAPLPRV